MTADQYKATFRPQSRKTLLAFRVLEDGHWHCRQCEYTHTGLVDIAGCVQFLRTGTKSRPGVHIASRWRSCAQCDRVTRQDKWRRSFAPTTSSVTIPPRVAIRIIKLLGERDVMSRAVRHPNQLAPHHKLPAMRWSPEEAARQADYSDLSDQDIRARFQLLTRSASGNSQLKRQACARCFESGQRGTPTGIEYFYAGGPLWEPGDKKDPRGCVGCGWYDYSAWRESLNATLHKARKE